MIETKHLCLFTEMGDTLEFNNIHTEVKGSWVGDAELSVLSRKEIKVSEETVPGFYLKINKNVYTLYNHRRSPCTS